MRWRLQLAEIILMNSYLLIRDAFENEEEILAMASTYISPSKYICTEEKAPGKAREVPKINKVPKRRRIKYVQWAVTNECTRPSYTWNHSLDLV